MTRPPLSTVSVILLAILALSGCSTMDRILGEKRPTASIVGAALEDIGASGATMKLDVEIANPYGIDVPVLALDYALRHQGRSFLEGGVEDAASIPARGSEVVSVLVRLPYEEILNLLGDVRPGSVLPVDTAVTLRLDVPGLGNLPINLQHQTDVPVPALPQIELRDFTWKTLGLSGAEADVVFQYTNNNQFPVSLQDLAYRFELAGKPVLQSRLGHVLQLEPGQSDTFRFNLNLSAMDLGMATLGLLKGGNADFALIGQARLGTEYGPIKLPVNTRGRTK